MITVSTRKLVSAIEEADVFHLPDRNEGTRYIYDEIYKRLSNGIEVRLSKINFSSFELDDIDTMRDLYFDILETKQKNLHIFYKIYLLSLLILNSYRRKKHGY